MIVILVEDAMFRPSPSTLSHVGYFWNVTSTNLDKAL